MKIPQTSAKQLLSFKRANQETFLSKVLSAILFITLPFVGFIIGYTHAGSTIPFSW
jgi:hypothetical protein